MHVTRGVLPLALYGFAGEEHIAEADNATWAIAQVASAGADAVAQGYALPVDYAALPDALLETILPRFGIALDSDETSRIAVAGGRYSKDPTRSFAPDSDEKRASAPPELLAGMESFGLRQIRERLLDPATAVRPRSLDARPSVLVCYRFD